MKILSKIFSFALWVEIILMVAIAICCFGGLPFGYKNFVVETASMVPTIEVGSMTYIDTNVDGKDVQKDDIIAFFINGDGAKVCVHRAVANDPTAQAITTKGDANETVDIAAVKYDEVLGKMAFSVPKLGIVCAWASSHGIAFAVIIIATALMGQACSRFQQSSKKTPAAEPVKEPNK